MKDEEYEFNPATDRITDGYTLENDLLVMPEEPFNRRYGSWGRKEHRQQQFARVTRLQFQGETMIFIGVWPDGYQQVISFHGSKFWIVHTKKATRNITDSRAYLGEKPWINRYVYETEQYDLKYQVRDFQNLRWTQE